MQETWVGSLAWEDPLEGDLEEGMATHSGILAWKIPWIRESLGLQSTCSKKSGMIRHTHMHTYIHIKFSGDTSNSAS